MGRCPIKLISCFLGKKNTQKTQLILNAKKDNEI